jgi:uncharacterized membrane protein YkvA (DUF1232 family)
VILAVEKKVIVDSESENVTALSGAFLPQSISAELVQEPGYAMNWKERALRLQKDAHVFYFVFKHPRTRWYARLIALCTAGYLFSPIQIIPNYIPVIGLLDDLVVLFLGVKVLQRITPKDVLVECRELADVAEERRKEKIRSTGAVIASVAVVVVWLVAAFVASALILKYVRH